MVPFTVFSFHRIVYLVLVWSDLSLAKFFVCDRVSLCNTSGLTLPEILLPLPPKNWDLRCALPHLEEWVVSVICLEVPIWLVSFAVQTVSIPLHSEHSSLLSPDA